MKDMFNKFKNISAKNKVLLSIIGIFLLCSIALGISYAFYQFTASQVGINSIDSVCFEISFTDKNDISLNNAYPITDDEASELTPYEFTIKNICSYTAQYQVNLEKLSTSTIENQYIKSKIDNGSGRLVSSLDEVTTYINDGISDSRKLTTGVLMSNQEKTYKLRLYLDENATAEQVASSSYSSKVVVVSTLDRNEYVPFILDANGGTFEDGSTIYTTYAVKEPTYDLIKYAHTDNIDDEGNTISSVNNGKYANNLSETKTVTIDGASKLSVEVWFSTESTSYDWLAIYDGTVEPSSTNYSQSVSGGKLGNGRLTTKPSDDNTTYHKIYTINGDTAKFYFKSDGSDSFYGYYAKVTGYDENDNRVPSVTPTGFNATFSKDIVPEPTKEGYIFKGWYSDAELTKSVAYDSKFSNEKTLYAKYVEDVALLDTGENLNFKIMSIADPSLTKQSYDNGFYGDYDDELFGYEYEYTDYYIDEKVKKFKRSETLENTDNLIQSEDSAYPIYAWFIDDTLYWYCEKNIIYLNPDSSILFRNFKKITNLDLDGIDSSRVTDMSGMFRCMESLVNLDLSSLNTQNVTNMSNMFYGMKSLTNLNLGTLNTTNVTDMSYMFAWLYRMTNLNLTSLDVHNVTNMSGIFAYSYKVSNINLDSWDTSNVENMSDMFCYMKGLTNLNLSQLDTSKVTNMNRMFYHTENISNIVLNDKFVTSNVTDMGNMFAGLKRLTSLDLSNFNTENVTNMSYMFSGMSGLTEIDLTPLNTENVTDMSYMFSVMSGLTEIDLTPLNTENVTSMASMFFGMSGLTEIDLTPLNTENVTSMASMFYGMSGLTEIDVSPLDTQNVESMYDMFSHCSSLTRLDVSTFDTSSLTMMRYMFSHMTNLETLILGSFDTSRVKFFDMLFQDDKNLKTLDLSSFDTSKITETAQMFLGCSKLETIYVGNNWNIDNVRASSSGMMFQGATSLVGGSGTKYNSSHTNKEYARVDDPDNGNPGYLTLKTT